MGSIDHEKVIEKVIKGLECCSEPGRNCNANCPYYDIDDNCEAQLISDVNAVIKIQELSYTPREVRDALIEYGQHDTSFKLGEIIKYDPVQVESILMEAR